MANIKQLPLELLCLVISHLPRKDLSALSCASKKIRTAVEPALYQEITFNWERNRTNHANHAPVHLLLRCIVERPDLALCIGRLEFCGQKPYRKWNCCKWRPRYLIPSGKSCSIWEHDNKPGLTSADMMVMASLISSLHLPAEDLWLRELYRGGVDVYIALLLSQTLNLCHLRLDSDFLHETSFVGAILKKAAAMSQQNPRLEVLEHINYSSDINNVSDVTYHDVDLDQILPLFSFPSIRSVRMALPAKNIVWPSQKAPVSSLTSLILHHTGLSEEMLGQLLLATPSLRSLQYHSWYNMEFTFGRPGRPHWKYLDCAKLGQSLACVQGPLEHLRISVRFFSLWTGVPFRGFRGMIGRLDTLHGFKNLLSLEIPIIVLLGWSAVAPVKLSNLLPLSLRHLSLTDDLHELGEDQWGDEALLPLIQEFLKERSFGTSEFESISLILNHVQTRWCEEARMKLKTLCEHARVQCQVVKVLNDLQTSPRASMISSQVVSS